MKKMNKIMKVLFCLCLTVTIILGTEMQAEAYDDGDIFAREYGKIITCEEGKSFKLDFSAADGGEDICYIYMDGEFAFTYEKLFQGDYLTVQESWGAKYAVLRLDDTGSSELYLYIDTVPDSGESSTSGGGSACHHDWTEEIIKYATQTEDGIVANKCKYCGEIQNGSKYIVSGYEIFNKDTAKAVRDAKESTVTVSTDRWVSFSKEVFAALEARTDVTLTVNYRFENKDYTVTIPAGTKGEGLLDENGFCGFRYLASVFHGSEAVK